MKNKLTLALLCFCLGSFAQLTPEITSWLLNTTGTTGWNGITINVTQVQYSTANVYVSCNSVGSYTNGTWSNPGTATAQGFVFKFTRTPQQNTGTPTAIGLGHTGVFTNGVSIFNADDGQTYNNAGVWHRNAYHFEGVSFDPCGGHPQQQGEYHHHVSPNCLYDQVDSTVHSPIIGYAFDGFPVYGTYGYANTDGTGGLKHLHSSYRTRNITDRTTLPDGSTAASAGPAIGGQYPLGAFIQDYEYVAGLGDLDEHNGRFCVTPEYPSGIYCYYATLSDEFDPEYPYTMCGTYYGIVQAGNTGPNGGHNTISETVTNYTGQTTAIAEPTLQTSFSIFPNPVSDKISLRSDNEVSFEFSNSLGQKIFAAENVSTASWSVSDVPAGVYYLRIQNSESVSVQQVVVAH